jgi:hypothetical protein
MFSKSNATTQQKKKKKKNVVLFALRFVRPMAGHRRGAVEAEELRRNEICWGCFWWLFSYFQSQ